MFHRPKAAIVTLLSPVVALPALASLPATTQWIVTSAKAAGIGGEQYVSSLRLLNLNAFDARVEITFLPQTAMDSSGGALGDNSNPHPVVVVVPAGQKVVLPDVFGTLSIAGGAGAFEVVSSGTDPEGRPLPIVASAATLVTASEGLVFGPVIPGQTPDELLGAGETASIPVLWSTALRSSNDIGYRSNVFLLSTNSETNTVVTVTLVRQNGAVAGTKDITLGKLAQTQINDVVAFFGYDPCGEPFGCSSSETDVFRELSLVASVKSGGPLALGASIIKNGNGSSVFVAPVKVATP